MKSFLRKTFSRLNEERIILRYLNEIDHHNDFIVDIGASDGIKMSNTYHLFKKGFTGIAVESDNLKFRRLQTNYSGFSQVKLVNNRVDPYNVCSLLGNHGCPENLLLLNLDIDSCDYFVLEAVLGEFHPKIIITEINEVIPPPVKFRVLPNQDFVWRGGHFFGYSITCLEELLPRFNYLLVELHYNNAFLVSRSIMKDHRQVPLDQLYRQGYFEARGRRKKFPYNREMDDLASLPAAEIIAELDRKFEAHRGKYDLWL